MRLRSGRRKSAVLLHSEAAKRAEKFGLKSKQKVRKGVKVGDNVYFMLSNDDDYPFEKPANQVNEEWHRSRRSHGDRYGSDTGVQNGRK